MRLSRVLIVLAKVWGSVLAFVLIFPAVWLLGYVSRVVAVSADPDGRVEAVCRGRLPESTEYELWFRKTDGMFGHRVGFVGTESMGRCRAVAWSPGGEVVAALTEGGDVAMFDGRSGKRIGYQRLLPRLEDGSYPSRRIVTWLRFESRDVVTFAHCARLFHSTRRGEDYRACGSDPVTEHVTLNLAVEAARAPR